MYVEAQCVLLLSNFFFVRLPLLLASFSSVYAPIEWWKLLEYVWLPFAHCYEEEKKKKQKPTFCSALTPRKTYFTLNHCVLAIVIHTFVHFSFMFLVLSLFSFFSISYYKFDSSPLLLLFFFRHIALHCALLSLAVCYSCLSALCHCTAAATSIFPNK